MSLLDQQTEEQTLEHTVIIWAEKVDKHAKNISLFFLTQTHHAHSFKMQYNNYPAEGGSSYMLKTWKYKMV